MSREPEFDADNPEWTAEDFKKAKPASELPAEVLKAFPKARGRPALEHPKRLVTMRLDADLVDRLRDSGPGWQSRVNEVLRKTVGL